MLDNFPIAKYFPFKAYQTEKEMTDRMFEILHNQIREQEKAFDPEAEIENLTGSLLKEKLGAENEVGTEEKAAILSDDYIINTM